ncbi:MAG: permease [Clostridiales bacterium]|nr:permease [Clostridiales bacterium]
METHLGSGVHFFFYDTIKIIILLGIMIFAISYIRSYFPPERTKKILERFSGITGNIMASLLGIVTPFCSCSSVPLFIGFVEAGIPLGVTFSFLITSPIVNEAAFAILLASFGWKIAFIYVATGVVVGVVGGILIGALKLEGEVEEYVYQIKVGEADIEEMTHKDRVQFAISNVKDIIKRIWIFLMIGIGIGALIHGWAPAPLLAKYAGPDNPFAVIVAVIFGIPLYSNALGTIPIAEALINKGVGIGTALAFMMATTALSLPEMILLRKVIKPKLIGVFVVITGIAIILVGYLFNGISHWLI